MEKLIFRNFQNPVFFRMERLRKRRLNFRNAKNDFQKVLPSRNELDVRFWWTFLGRALTEKAQDETDRTRDGFALYRQFGLGGRQLRWPFPRLVFCDLVSYPNPKVFLEASRFSTTVTSCGCEGNHTLNRHIVLFE